MKDRDKEEKFLKLQEQKRIDFKQIREHKERYDERISRIK